jgi:hypothetical protein
MSDLWEVYQCQIGEYPAFISYDDGIRHSIAAVAPPVLIRVRVKFLAASDAGLPAGEEFASLSALEERLEEEVSRWRGLYVGRVTVAGSRYFHVFADAPAHEISASLRRVSEGTGYEIGYVQVADPEFSGYWRDLYPSEEERQVIENSKVLESLKRLGDDHSIPRRIDHWCYFDTPAARSEFESWALATGFQRAGHTEPTEANGQYGLRVHAVARPETEEITEVTLSLLRRAKEFGGDYDGWETKVERGPG